MRFPASLPACQSQGTAASQPSPGNHSDGPGTAGWREGTGGYSRVLGKEELELEGRGRARFLDHRVCYGLQR